jgi:hypothetical protein
MFNIKFDVARPTTLMNLVKCSKAYWIQRVSGKGNYFRGRGRLFSFQSFKMFNRCSQPYGGSKVQGVGDGACSCS